jgi:hypothetical protein
MSRLSIRSLKSSTVSIAAVFDPIRKSLKWSLVPLAALAAVALSPPRHLHPLANTAARM